MSSDEEYTSYEDTRISAVKLRRVWAIVTAHPEWPVRRLATALQMPFGSVGQALWHLERAGYIERSHGKVAAIRVLVPFFAPWDRLPRRAARPYTNVANPANWKLKEAPK